MKLVFIYCICLFLGVGCSTTDRVAEPWGGDKATPPKDLFSNPHPTKPGYK